MSTSPKRSVSQHTRADGSTQTANRLGGEFDTKNGPGQSGAAADVFGYASVPADADDLQNILLAGEEVARHEERVAWAGLAFEQAVADTRISPDEKLVLYGEPRGDLEDGEEDTPIYDFGSEDAPEVDDNLQDALYHPDLDGKSSMAYITFDAERGYTLEIESDDGTFSGTYQTGLRSTDPGASFPKTVEQAEADAKRFTAERATYRDSAHQAAYASAFERFGDLIPHELSSVTFAPGKGPNGSLQVVGAANANGRRIIVPEGLSIAASTNDEADAYANIGRHVDQVTVHTNAETGGWSIDVSGRATDISPNATVTTELIPGKPQRWASLPMFEDES